MSSLSATKIKLDIDATPTVGMCRLVSYQKYSMYPLLVKDQ
jgi:hypothetical protein